MFILGASSLFRALNSQEYRKTRHLRILGVNQSAIISGLNCHRRTPKARKSIFTHIREAEPTEEFVIWHDAINNSFSPHFSNFDSPLTGPELADSLKTVSSRIRSIIYCQRTETSNIYRDLQNAGLPVVDVVKEIASRKGDISEELKQLYKRLHQPSSKELKKFLSCPALRWIQTKNLQEENTTFCTSKEKLQAKETCGPRIFSNSRKCSYLFEPGTSAKSPKEIEAIEAKTDKLTTNLQNSKTQICNKSLLNKL